MMSKITPVLFAWALVTNLVGCGGELVEDNFRPRFFADLDKADAAGFDVENAPVANLEFWPGGMDPDSCPTCEVLLPDVTTAEGVGDIGLRFPDADDSDFGQVEQKLEPTTVAMSAGTVYWVGLLALGTAMVISIQIQQGTLDAGALWDALEYSAASATEKTADLVNALMQAVGIAEDHSGTLLEESTTGAGAASLESAEWLDASVQKALEQVRTQNNCAPLIALGALQAENMVSTFLLAGNPAQQLHVITCADEMGLRYVSPLLLTYKDYRIQVAFHNVGPAPLEVMDSVGFSAFTPMPPGHTQLFGPYFAAFNDFWVQAAIGPSVKVTLMFVPG